MRLNPDTKNLLFGIAFLCALSLPLLALAYDLKLNLDYPSFGGFKLDNQSNGLVQIIGWLYYAIVGLSGAAAFLMLLWGGIQWLSSSGNPSLIGDARDRMQNALLGLLLVLSSVLIIRIINPELSILREPTLQELSREKLKNPFPEKPETKSLFSPDINSGAGAGCPVRNPKNYQITAGFHSALYAVDFPELAPHQGVDLNTGAGTEVFAVASGRKMEVAEVKNQVEDPARAACGNNPLYIDHGLGVIAKYCHLQEVYQFSTITAGAPVGRSGSSGTQAAHLHFQLRDAKEWVDPRMAVACLKNRPCEQDKRGSWCEQDAKKIEESIVSAQWENTFSFENSFQSKVNETVTLAANTNLPQGTQVMFEIYEDDLGKDDSIRTQAQNTALFASVDENGKAAAAWTISREDIDRGKTLTDVVDVKFYFIAKYKNTAPKESDGLFVPIR